MSTTATSPAQQPLSHAANIEYNKVYFDGLADKYDSIQGARELIGYIASAARESVALDKERTDVLDFGCGIGVFDTLLQQCYTMLTRR